MCITKVTVVKMVVQLLCYFAIAFLKRFRKSILSKPNQTSCDEKPYLVMV